MTIYDKAIRNECAYPGPFPYWDWSIDSEAPEQSEIWKSFGTTGCIPNLPGFSAVDATFPQTHCLLRNMNFQESGSLFSPEQMGFIQSETNYISFNRILEGTPHNLIHSSIGGDMGNPMLSPNDPIFYLHHRNVDRHWAKWQKSNPTPTMAEIFVGTNTDNVPRLMIK